MYVLSLEKHIKHCWGKAPECGILRRKSTMTEYNYSEIHRLCGWHEEAIKSSVNVGCFYCLKIYPPSKIVEWIDEAPDCPRGPGKTAVCPYCDIDSVLPESELYQLTQEFINDMGSEFFRASREKVTKI